MKIALFLLIAALVVGGVLFARVYKENRLSIDCGKQAGTVGIVALRRDEGATREQARAHLATPDFQAYSAAQVEAMLDAVYVDGIGKSVEQIRVAAYEECDRKTAR